MQQHRPENILFYAYSKHIFQGRFVALLSIAENMREALLNF